MCKLMDFVAYHIVVQKLPGSYKGSVVVQRKTELAK